MGRTIKTMMMGTLLISGMFIMLSMTNNTFDDWIVPAQYKNMKNPYLGKKDADNIGKELWNEHCKSCHGKEGYGDGKKSGELETELRDFSTEEMQAQTDGEIYYKTVTGRDEMPSFKKKIPSKEDRWFLVNYVRTLKE